MREIVLDTETTGLNPFEGHRIVEIGAVELWHQVPTGRTYHQYINPERDMPAEAFNVHGISEEFLADKPVFTAIARAFLDFVTDSKLVIHNASFDMRFLGSPASLDALCRRFGIDNSMREKHGALLDSEILADVYLELIGGKQPDFVLEQGSRTTAVASDEAWHPTQRAKKLAPRISEAEASAHAAFVEELGPDAIWYRARANS